MSKLTRIEGVGDAPIYRGDPRLPESDMDGWLREMLAHNPVDIRARPYLYGSDAGFCARRNALLEKNEWLEDSVNAAGTAFMAIGVALENQLADAVRRSGKLVVQGIRAITFPEIHISAKFDLVVFDPSDEIAIIEVKTCGELPREPKPAHLAQIQTYSAISGIRRCTLTYISRAIVPLKPLATRSFAVDCGDAALSNRLQIAALSRLTAERNLLAPVPATFRKHTECHYCQFRDYFCFGTRPGLGGDAPSQPLRDATPGELIALDAEAASLAETALANIEYRRLETLQSLLAVSPISNEHADLLSKEIYRQVGVIGNT